MRTNAKAINERKTHEGAPASPLKAEQELRRTVMACLLWEGQFYEDGEAAADRIKRLVRKVDPVVVAAMALEARSRMKLRHVPLLLCRELARRGGLNVTTLAGCIQRADELSEFLALYWQDGKCPVSAAVKRGLALAFNKFDAYQFAKYNRQTEVKLRDAMFLSHPKPKDDEQAKVFAKLADGTLEPPDTWEVRLSATKGEGKKAAWEDLLKRGRLGAMALIRNLRNMEQASVDEAFVRKALAECKPSRLLPFRFVSAAIAAPRFEAEIETAMMKCLGQIPKLPGKTILIVDVSGSMYGRKLSERSSLDRARAACALAILVREVCETPVIYATAGNDRTEVHSTELVPARRGFALSDAIYGQCDPLGGGGIFLKQVLDCVREKEKVADRIIVITDEQDCDHDPKRTPLNADTFGKQNYLINVAAYKNGIGYGKWTHIDGWSEAALDYIRESERQNSATVQAGT